MRTNAHILLEEAYQKVYEQQIMTDAPGMYDKIQASNKQDSELYNKVQQINDHFKNEALVFCYKALVLSKNDPKMTQACIKHLNEMFNKPESFKDLPTFK